MVNPEEGDPQAVIAGKPLYHLRCARCHDEQLLYSSDGYPGRVYKLSLSGKVIGVIGKQLKQFGWIHEIACPSENELNVSELLNWRVQKLVLEPSH